MQNSKNEIAIIAAVAKNNAIGLNNQLIWHLPADLKYFKNLTTGNVIIMGKNTYLSIGKPLPNRKNIVVTSSKISLPEEVSVCNSLESAIELGKNSGNKIFIVGGANVYNQAIQFADLLYITEVDIEPYADTFFPNINLQSWQLNSVEEGVLDEKNKIPHRFKVYERK